MNEPTASPAGPDPAAIRLLDAVDERLEPDLAILFGSRARGDYTPDSDLDLLLVTPHPNPPYQHPWYQRAEALAAAIYKQPYSPLSRPVIWSPQQFADSLRSINGLAAKACREGIIRAAPGLPVPRWDPDQTDQEPEQTRQILERTAGDLKTFVVLAPDPRVAMPAGRQLFHAYRNALLAAYSAARLEYDHRASLVDLAHRATPAVPAIAAVADSPRLPLLDRLYDRTQVKFCGGQYPDWKKQLIPAQKEINRLTEYAQQSLPVK